MLLTVALDVECPRPPPSPLGRQGGALMRTQAAITCISELNVYSPDCPPHMLTVGLLAWFNVAQVCSLTQAKAALVWAVYYILFEN